MWRRCGAEHKLKSLVSISCPYARGTIEKGIRRRNLTPVSYVHLRNHTHIGSKEPCSATHAFSIESCRRSSGLSAAPVGSPIAKPVNSRTMYFLSASAGGMVQGFSSTRVTGVIVHDGMRDPIASVVCPASSRKSVLKGQRGHVAVILHTRPWSRVAEASVPRHGEKHENKTQDRSRQ